MVSNSVFKYIFFYFLGTNSPKRRPTPVEYEYFFLLLRLAFRYEWLAHRPGMLGLKPNLRASQGGSEEMDILTRVWRRWVFPEVDSRSGSDKIFCCLQANIFDRVGAYKIYY